MKRRMLFAMVVLLGLAPQRGWADCDLFLRLSGCVQDAATRKPLIGARVLFEGTIVYTDDRGCWVITEQRLIPTDDFYPTNYCIAVYLPGYEVGRFCQRRESLEPFPPCPNPPVLSLSLQFGVISLTELSTEVSDPEAPVMPGEFELYQNYPNPFNPDTRISFALGSVTNVTLDVFDVLGRRVARLHDGMLPAGLHEIPWNAADAPSGVYFYRLRAGDRMLTRRMVLLR